MSRRYPRPKFDPELAKKVENIVVSCPVGVSPAEKGRIDKLVVVFTGVKVLVLADQLFSTCHEYSEELVWLRGQLGDEMSSITQLNVDKLWHESEIEKRYRHFLRDLPLWKEPVGYMVLNMVEDKGMNLLFQNWLTIREWPIVVRRSVVTANTKDVLIDICGSEDNFQALTGLDWKYVQGKHKYSGSLDRYQQLSFLELMLTTFSADLESQGCSHDRDAGQKITFLLDRIDMLVLEM